MFEWAKKMGIEVLVTETTPNAVHDKLCTEYNIKMALHNHPQSWPPEKVLAACKDRCKLIGSCARHGPLDAGQPRPRRYAEDARRPRRCTCTSRTSTSFGDGHDVPWGTGKGDVQGMMAELKRQGYKRLLLDRVRARQRAATWPQNLPKCVAFFDRTAAELAK